MVTGAEPMDQDAANRFDDFFQETAYLSLKNHLYNYQVRKRAVREWLPRGQEGSTLDVGSGISPIAAATDRTVYTDLSFTALACLRRQQSAGQYVVADAGRLPFRAGMFQNAVCSEVLEHIEDDGRAVGELARVLAPGGRLAVTFPHRRDFFSVDDRFVGHHRRYELSEMLHLLQASGLRCQCVRKVLGPLEKLTMGIAIALLTKLPFATRSPAATGTAIKPVPLFVRGFVVFNRLYAALARLDARIVPTRLATVLLIAAEKGPESGR